MPLVSVIIPTIRRPELVVRAIASVQAQTCRDLEIIVVIDGPDAETAAALADIDEPRMRVLQNPLSLRPGPARNAGAKLARGEWLAFLDDDDEWLPDKLDRQLAGRTSSEAVVITCRCRVENAEGMHIWPRTLYDGRQRVDEYLFDRKSLGRGEVYLATPTYLLPTWLFARTGFGEVDQNEDTTMLLRATKQCGARILMLPDPLVVIHENPDHSFGFNFSWRACLPWLDGVAGLMSRRAYSGYCLITLGAQAAKTWDLRAVPVLLGRSFARGAPSLLQLAFFASFWLFPQSVRRYIRLAILRRRVARSPGGEF